MTTIIRRLIFSAFFILFIIIGASVVLYSYGYRIDFETLQIRKTGAVSVKTEPRDIIIKLNNKVYPDKSNMVQSETLITDLIPKLYHLKVEKAGYFAYYKDLKVEPSIVARALNILLVPKEIQSEDLFPVRGEIISNFDTDENKIIIKNEKSGIFYLYDKNNASSSLNLSASLFNFKTVGQIKNLSFVPFDSNFLVVEDGLGLRLFNAKKESVETLIKSPIGPWTIKSPNLYFFRTEALKSKSVKFLSYYSLIFKTVNDLSPLPDELQGLKFTKIKASDGSGKIAFLDEAGNLYLYDQTAKNFIKIATDIKDSDFSSDNKKIAFLNYSNKLTVYFLEDFNSDIKKKAGEKIIINLSEYAAFKNIKWRNDSFHLFLSYGKEVKITEIDDRPPLNIFPLFSGVSDFYYSTKNNLIYLIKNGKLQKIDLNNQ